MRTLTGVKPALLRDTITLLLTRRPGSTARYLAETIGVSKAAVNAVLYKYPDRFEATDAATLTAVGGSLVDAAGEPITTPVLPGSDVYLRPELADITTLSRP